MAGPMGRCWWTATLCSDDGLLTFVGILKFKFRLGLPRLGKSHLVLGCQVLFSPEYVLTDLRKKHCSVWGRVSG
eukprot:190336-Heterocapsa_arctica.AAC.1